VIDVDSAPNTATLLEVPIDDVEVAGFNPRTNWDFEALIQLANSIREHGILEPLVVRRKLGGSCYQLIAGERRLKAAYQANLPTVPVRVVDVDDRTAQELGLVENLVREDLDAIEVALAFQKLADLGVKQAEIGRRVGKSQPLVANTLRLLNLPADVQERIRRGELSTAHGVSLARFAKFPEVCSAIAEQAVRSNLTSKGIDSEEIPYSYILEQKGLIRTVDSRYAFRQTHCKQCPFQAYSNQGHDGYWGRCLKPAHFDDLKAAEEAERHAAVIAESRSTSASGESLPVVDRLEYGTYEDLSSRGAPAGCKLTACPNYSHVLFHGRPATLCMDPKCFKRLKTAQTKAENKARKLAIQAMAKALAAATKPLTEIGPREAAIVACYALSCADASAIAPALKARGIPENVWKKPETYTTNTKLLEEYAKLDPRDLLLAVVEALVQGECHQELDSGNYVSGRVNLRAGEWYLGEPPTEAERKVAEWAPEILAAAGREPAGIPKL
jgi:ParB/RepB/Spo0J family partition protein